MAAEATFKDVPELFEVDLGEALTARTESLSTFRELGPPDLCHVVKSTGKSGQADIGSYHFVSGVDASSSASLAAYINSLTYGVSETSTWFAKAPTWKVRNGSYCCFNAFARVDVRVDVRIPGGVNAYIIDLRGERHDATPEIWQETYVSAVLRAVLYSDDPSYFLDAYRRLDPITTPETELRFLQAAEALFVKGWQVGSDPEIQVATIVSNHLTAAVLKYFGNASRWQVAANLFEKLAAREPEVSSLLARAYLGMNEEVKAVQIMSSAMRATPASYTLLHAQVDFLRSKGKFDWALKLARQAVNCAPSEFVTWEKITEVYIDLGEYESALLTLNSCPMFTFNGRDQHRALTPARVHLPSKPAVLDILPQRVKTEDDEADPALLRLPAPGLRGTWARAYGLLTRLVSYIGWDELLKTRSAVFVMEEEYRAQKAAVDVPPSSTAASGTLAEGNAHESTDSLASADDDASIRGEKSAVDVRRTSAESAEDGEGAIPTIRISSESDRQRAAQKVPNGDAGAKHADEEAAEDLQTPVAGEVALDEPVKASMRPEGADGEEQTPANPQDAFSFSNKRLCERWLDNLFMVLYEDLRVWTIYRAEVAHFKTQHIAYRKTGLEWEILGDLGTRLHHKEEAKESYQRALDASRYAAKPWLKLMETYADEGDLPRTLQTAIRVAAYQYGEYTEMTYPTAIGKSFFKLGQVHGHQKISYTLLSMGLPDPILKIMESYLHYGQLFKVEGYDF